MDRSPGARLKGDSLSCNQNVDQGEHRQREYQQACAKEKETPEQVVHAAPPSAFFASLRALALARIVSRLR